MKRVQPNKKQKEATRPFLLYLKKIEFTTHRLKADKRIPRIQNEVLYL
jgi:hypothetical protein